MNLLCVSCNIGCTYYKRRCLAKCWVVGPAFIILFAVMVAQLKLGRKKMHLFSVICLLPTIEWFCNVSSRTILPEVK